MKHLKTFVQINEELNIATASTTQPTKSGTVRNSNLFDVPLDLIEKHMIQYKKENPDEDEHNLEYEKWRFIEYYQDKSQMDRIKNYWDEKAKKNHKEPLKK